jgi:MraZ protein
LFLGLHHVLMDDKGRVALPTPLSQALARMGAVDGKFVLTQSLYDHCLVGMTEVDFLAQAEKVRALPPSHPAVVAFKRFVIAPAQFLSADKVGRLAIPKELREHAELEREAVWLGVMDKIELWSRTRYDDLRRRHDDDAAAARAYLTEHGL